MKSRVLGKSGIEVSEIGLGCWQLGGDFGPLDELRAEQILSAAHTAGITFWDTADVYGGGVSEQRIARFVRAHGPKVVVATKVGRDGSLYPDQYSRAGVRACLENSARRLEVERLDLVQLHCVPPELLRDGEIFTWLEDLQSEGLIQSFGASVETLEEARLAAAQPSLTSLQIIFNLFRQDAIESLFPLAIENDVGIIVRLPLASGVLSGKMTADTEFAETDHRSYNRDGKFFSQGETFSGIPFSTAVNLADRLAAFVPDGMSMAQMAMRWLLDHPAVSTVITGASRPEQVIENAAVSALPPLPESLHDQLARFYAEDVAGEIVVPV